MNASSTTCAPSTSSEGTKFPGIASLCPEWCTDDDTEHPAHTDSDLSLRDGGTVLVIDHSGPTFGPFFCQAEVEVGGGTFPAVSYDHVVIDRLFESRPGYAGGATGGPGPLRQLAAHALAAADWMEAHGSAAWVEAYR